MNNEIEAIKKIKDSLTALIKGEKCLTIQPSFNNCHNELILLSEKINEIINYINIYTDYIFSLSAGNLSIEVPGGKMRMHDALKNLQASLNHLTWKTQRIAGGDFNQTIDFMGEFSKAFNSMTLQLKQAFEIIESQKNSLQIKEFEMNRDLKLAGIIQNSLLASDLKIDSVAVHKIYTPMIQVGGDIYNFVEFRSEEMFGVFIADINGHGVHAALLTGILKVLINTAGELRRKPAELMYYFNSRIVDLGIDIYFTAFYCICDLKNKSITYARGGHNLPFLIHANEQPFRLDSSGPLLGVIKDIHIDSRTAELRQGDKLILFTDGLTETENIDGVPFEESLFPEILIENANMNIENYVNSIYSALIEFRGSEKFDDDVCIIGIEIL